jgi:hypothetical protein
MQRCYTQCHVFEFCSLMRHISKLWIPISSLKWVPVQWERPVIEGWGTPSLIQRKRVQQLTSKILRFSCLTWIMLGYGSRWKSSFGRVFKNIYINYMCVCVCNELMNDWCVLWLVWQTTMTERMCLALWVIFTSWCHGIMPCPVDQNGQWSLRTFGSVLEHIISLASMFRSIG